MIPTVLAASAVALARSLAALRLQRWLLGGPVVMALAGIVVGLCDEHSTAAALNTKVAQHAAEVILAFLLFVDATEVRGGRLWGNSPGLVARILLLALPLGLGAAMLLGAVLLPGLSWALLLIVACVVVPIDFAASEQIVRDRRLSSRVRSVLNVESGYNDGIVSPLFVFALLLTGSGADTGAPWHALADAATQAAKAVGVGLFIGALVARLMQQPDEAEWTTDQSRRIAVVLTPLLTYAVAVEISGNGFVASFVCGITFRYVYRALVARRIHRAPAAQRGQSTVLLTRDFSLIEDVTALMTLSMWFVTGLAAVVVVDAGVSWQVAVFCLLALTAVRVVPVFAALTGSTLACADRLLIGLLGPRGTTSIVFGLIAYNGLPIGRSADTVLLATVLCVLGSVLLHGAGSDLVIRRLGAPARPPR